MLAAILPLAPPPLATLRPSRDPVDADYRKLPYTLDAKSGRPAGSQALWLAGRDSGIRLPLEWRAWATRNRRGDVAGFAVLDFSGAYTGRCVRTFVRPKGGRTVVIPVPRPDEFTDLFFCGLDERGRVLVLPARGLPGVTMDRPFFAVPHAYLWTPQGLRDLGPAQTARWTPRGTVAGVYWTDEAGRPINGDATDVQRTLRDYEVDGDQREESVSPVQPRRPEPREG